MIRLIGFVEIIIILRKQNEREFSLFGCFYVGFKNREEGRGSEEVKKKKKIEDEMKKKREKNLTKVPTLRTSLKGVPFSIFKILTASSNSIPPRRTAVDALAASAAPPLPASG